MKIKQVRSFIGLASFYRKFIPNFADIARPLTNLTRKEVKFVWGDKQEQAFNELKQRLMLVPMLKHFS